MDESKNMNFSEVNWEQMSKFENLKNMEKKKKEKKKGNPNINFLFVILNLQFRQITKTTKAFQICSAKWEKKLWFQKIRRFYER